MSDNWKTIRIRNDLKTEAEDFIKNTSFGGLSDFITYLVRKELEK